MTDFRSQHETETIERLTERCEAYKGQVEAGASEIARLTARVEELEMARDILDTEVKFDECKTSEPSIRQMIRQYYIQGLQPDTDLALQMADRFIAALTPRSSVEGK